MATNLSHIWQAMEAVRGDPEALRALLADATAEQLIYLRRRYVFLADDLVRVPAFSAHGGERAPALARWVVTRGRAAWRDARHEPDKLPREPPPAFRDLEPVFEEVYRARFGGDLPYLEPDPAGQTDLFHTAEWEQRLWNLIEYLNIGTAYEDALEGFTRSQLAQLTIEFNHLRTVLWRRFEPIFGDSPRDFSWYEWTDWMISQGREAYERALAHPELAPRGAPEDGSMWLSKIVEVYQERYAGDEPPTFPGVREIRKIVLGLIRDDGGKATWHRLATRLPSYRVPPDTDVMQVVEELRVRGWVASTREANGTERWRITPLGEAALDGKPAPAGVLAPGELSRFIAGLRGGAVASAQAVMPYMNDGLKLWAVLRQALAADASAARDIAAAGLYLPRTERGPFARELLDAPQPEVREALLRAWTPVDLDAPGKPLPTVPDGELDELLRRGLLDPSPAVREAAAALAYAAMRGASLVPELVVNLGAPERALRCWALLALGAASDPVSLDLLRQHATGDEPAEAAAAIRALGQRADGYPAWRYGLQDRRPEVRAAALHALATVVPELPAEDLARWSADADPELQRAVAAYRARREAANSRNPR